jgi:hypothetical protein
MRNTEVAKIGRPSKYSEALIDEICERIANGESLNRILKDDHMPDYKSVTTWLDDPNKPEFLQKYARARELQAETLADEIVSIADETDVTIDDHGKVTFDSVAVARNRLRVDARKWVAAKLKPKKYGDKIEATHTGSVTLQISEQDERI